MQHLDSPIQLEITARRLSELQHECDEITVIERRRNRPRCMLSVSNLFTIQLIYRSDDIIVRTRQ